MLNGVCTTLTYTSPRGENVEIVTRTANMLNDVCTTHTCTSPLQWEIMVNSNTNSEHA